MQKDSRFVGLLVQHKYAKQFLECDPKTAKTMEIRIHAVRFLREGDHIILVSCCGKSNGRKALGILQFQGSVKIALTQLAEFQALHQIGEEDQALFTNKAKEKGVDNFWGWSFKLRHRFSDPLPLDSSAAEVWVHITPAEIFKAGLLTSFLAVCFVCTHSMCGEVHVCFCALPGDQESAYKGGQLKRIMHDIHAFF